MDPLAELLASLADLESITDPAILETMRLALAAEAAERKDLTTAEALAELEQIADGLDAVKARETALAAEATERAARAQAALDRIAAATAAAPDGETDETPAPAADEVLEPVAAAATPLPIVGKVAARRPAATKAKVAEEPVEPAKWGLVASANVDGFRHGEALDDPDKIAKAFASTIEATRGWKSGRTEIRVASRYADLPPERTLGRDIGDNRRKIEAVTSLRALMASGGVCAPTPIQYDLPVIGSDARPVRDNMLARFGADRGGVTLLPPPHLSQITDGTAVATWTEANDQNPSNPSTKPCLTVTCPSEEETLVDAVTRCLKFGNYRARFFPEQIEAWTTLLGVRHARHAETKLLTDLGALCTTVTTGVAADGLGTSRDVLAQVDRIATRFRNYHRLPRTYPMRFAAPEWLLANFRTDRLREIPGSTDEVFAIADAQIEAWFKARNINPTWFMDGESGQVFGAQPDGHALQWITNVVCYLYPEGSFLFLDGGSLDLGIVRDSTNNETNDVQMFAETFEAVAFHGVEAFRITMDICPSGATSAPIDYDPCTTGS